MHEIIKRLDDIGSNLGWPVYAAVARDAAAIIRAQAERIARLERAEARLLSERHEVAALRQTAEEKAAWYEAECRRLEDIAFEPHGTSTAGRRTWRQRYDEAVAVDAKQREEIDLLRQQLASSRNQLAAAADAISELRRRVDAAGTRGVELTRTIAGLRKELEVVRAEAKDAIDEVGVLKTRLDYSRATAEHWHSLYETMLKKVAEIESMKAPVPIPIGIDEAAGPDFTGVCIRAGDRIVGMHEWLHAEEPAACAAQGDIRGAWGMSALDQAASNAHNEMANDLNARLSKVEERMHAVEVRQDHQARGINDVAEALAAHRDGMDKCVPGHHNGNACCPVGRLFCRKG